MTSVEIDEIKRELIEAGWKAKTPTIWKSPKGRLFLGPYGAWKAMHSFIIWGEPSIDR